VRRLNWWGILAGTICVAELIFEIRLALLPESLVVPAFVRDDVFYFLEPAWNWAHGMGITFDGEHWSNGFQPIWFLVCSLLALFTDHGQFLQAVLILSALCNAVTGLLLCWTGAKLGSRFIGFFATYVWICVLHFPFVNLALGGFEWPLNVLWSTLCLALTLRLVTRKTPQSLRSYLALCLLWAILPLVRVDNLPITFMAGLFLLAHYLFTHRDEPELKRFLGVIIGVLILAAPFGLNCIFQEIVFDSALPVSAKVKVYRHLEQYDGNLFSPENVNEGLAFLPSSLIRVWTCVIGAVERFGGLLWEPIGYWLKAIPAGLFFLPLVVALLTWGRGEDRPQRRWCLVLFVFAVIAITVRSIAYAFLIRKFDWYNIWHYGFEFAFWQIVLLYSLVLFGRCFQFSYMRRIPFQIMVMLVCLGCLQNDYRLNWNPETSPLLRKKDPWRANLLELAQQLGSYVPRDARIGADNAGILGFYSHHKVVNLDGLINTTQYYDEIVSHRREHDKEYFIVEELDYFVEIDYKEGSRFDGLRFEMKGEKTYEDAPPILIAKCLSKIPYENKQLNVLFQKADSFYSEIQRNKSVYRADLPQWLLAGSYDTKPYDLYLSIAGEDIPYGLDRDDFSPRHWVGGNRGIYLIDARRGGMEEIEATLSGPLIELTSSLVAPTGVVRATELKGGKVVRADGVTLVEFPDAEGSITFEISGLDWEEPAVIVYEFLVSSGGAVLTGPPRDRELGPGVRSGWFPIFPENGPALLTVESSEPNTVIHFVHLGAHSGEYPVLMTDPPAVRFEDVVTE